MTDYTGTEFWKGAPETSTHYQPPRGEGFNPVFWRVDNGVPVEAWAVMQNGRFNHVPKPSYIDDVLGRLIPRPTPQWSGEGLPPIGTFVRISDDGSLYYGANESGEVIAHVENCAVVRMSYGLGCFTARYLEPIKTHEQIAAEQREDAIDVMAGWAGVTTLPTDVERRVLGRLYDAGYRKGDAK